MGVDETAIYKNGMMAGGAGMPGVTVLGRAINCQPFRDGQSVLVSLPQRATVARTCTATYQSSAPPVTNEGTYGYDGTDDGSDNMAVAANTILAVSTTWTTTAIRQLHQVSFWLSRVGTPAIAGGGMPSMIARIYTDAAGDPNAMVTAYQARVNCTDIPLATTAAMTKCTFTFDCPVDLAALTTYHVVLTANYDVSAANYIQVHYNTVGAGAQRCRQLDVAWGAAALKNYWCEILELNFAAEGAGILPATAHTVIQADGANGNNVFIERRLFNVNALVRGPYIRPVLVFSAGAFTWQNVGIGVLLNDPLNIPTVDAAV